MSKNLFKRILTSLILLILLLITIFSYNIVFILSLFILCCIVCFEANSIFEKIYRDFSICHVHPNNCSEVISYDGIDIPKIIEITFIRNDYVNELKTDNSITLPHKLDNRNVKGKNDIQMPNIWWNKKL